MSFQPRLITSTDEFIGLEQVWNDLLAKSPADNYFLSWEWLWNWWQVYGRPEDRLAILVIENGEEIAGIAPFYLRKRFHRGVYPVRRMMFLGTQDNSSGDVCSDYMNIICLEGLEERMVRTVFEQLVNRNICDEVFLSRMDNSSKVFGIFREHAGRNGCLNLTTEECTSPYIKLPVSWEEYMKGLSGSMRQKIRREFRKLEKYDFTISRAESPDAVFRYYGELVRLHKKRWNSRGIEGAFSNELFNQFHKKIMPSMLQKGRLELKLLLENGESRAAIYNIKYKNKIYFYQCGVDTSGKKAAFGYALHARCIEDAIKEGMAEYDFLPKAGGDNYKEHFAKQKRTVSNVYVIRQWALKRIMFAEETARLICRHVKPYFGKKTYD